MTRSRVLARRSIPVADTAPVQLNLGLVWSRPIAHRRRRAAQHPAPLMAQAVRRAA